MASYEELANTDFEQCFNQMRHYDIVFINMVSFILAGYTAVIATSAALIGSSLDKKISMGGISALLFFVSVSATFLIGFLMRNRVYYVYVARFANEVRHQYLQHQPYGIANQAGLYTNFHSPKAWNWGSTHLILLYFISFINSVAISFGGLLLRTTFSFPNVNNASSNLLLGIGLFITYFLFEIIWITRYLKSKDRVKTADEGVFGTGRN